MQSRRDFLQKLTGSALVLSAAPGTLVAGCANSPSAHNDQILRVAILGLGSYGTRVADAMQTCQKAKLVGAISGTPAKLPAWQSKYNIPARNCYNYRTMDQI